MNGGFDERYFPAFEDIEFFSRLRRLGINAQCVWRAAVDHPLRPIPNSRKLAARWRPEWFRRWTWEQSRANLREAAEACAVSHTLPLPCR